MFPDNNLRQITAQRFRSFADNLIDTMFSLAGQAFVNGSYDAANGVLTLTRANGMSFMLSGFSTGGVGGLTLATVLAAIMEGSHIDIDRSVMNEITINYDAGGGGGGGGTNTRYALLTSGSATPTAAEFQAGFTSETNEITVDGYATPMYLHFADIHAQLATIQQTTSQFNGRMGFAATPVALMIGGSQHYVYSSIAARNPVGQRTWRLVA